MDTQRQTIASRVARNEDAFRRANERIEQAAEQIAPDFERIPFICECPQVGCTEISSLTWEEYEDVRANGRTFLVVPGHEVTEVEGVTIARLSRKFEHFSRMEKVGEAGEVSEQLDPRDPAGA